MANNLPQIHAGCFRDASLAKNDFVMVTHSMKRIFHVVAR